MSKTKRIDILRDSEASQIALLILKMRMSISQSIKTMKIMAIINMKGLALLLKRLKRRLKAAAIR